MLSMECSGLMVAIYYSLALVPQIVSWGGNLLRGRGDGKSSPGPPGDRENGEWKEGSLEPPVEDEDPWLGRPIEPLDAPLGASQKGITVESCNEHRGMSLLLLLGGDIETNPGPTVELADPTRDRENEPFDDSVGCVR